MEKSPDLLVWMADSALSQIPGDQPFVLVVWCQVFLITVSVPYLLLPAPSSLCFCSTQVNAKLDLFLFNISREFFVGFVIHTI